MTAPVLIPRTATLDGFVEASADGINVLEIEPMTTLLVRTCNSHYRLLVSSNAAIHVQGGRFFPGVTPARLDGSSAGGSLLKVGWIAVGLRMEISTGDQRIVTSPVRAIAREDASPSRPH